MILSNQLEKYIEEHTSQESEILKSLNRSTNLRTYYPNMLSGKVQGKFLEMISRMIKPDSILEIGTFTGYSAIALAQGLSDRGKMITLELNEELAEMIDQFIQQSGLKHKIELLIGDALKIIPGMNEQFDLVFIDADKEQYISYYELAIPKVKPGGFIIADNVFWNGKVLEPDFKSDKETLGIKSFNDHVKNDSRVEQVMLSVRDGLLLIRKL